MWLGICHLSCCWCITFQYVHLLFAGIKNIVPDVISGSCESFSCLMRKASRWISGEPSLRITNLKSVYVSRENGGGEFHVVYISHIITLNHATFLWHLSNLCPRVATVECRPLRPLPPGLRHPAVLPVVTGILHTTPPDPKKFWQASRDQLHDLHPSPDKSGTKHPCVFRKHETDDDTDICLDTVGW